LPATYAIEEPPHVDLYTKELPLLLADAKPVPQRSVEVNLRIGRAEALYQAGSELFLKGKADEGRMEFDRALELLATAPAALPDRQRLIRKYEQLVEAIHRLEVESAGQAADPEPAVDRPPIEEIAEMTFPTEPGLKGKVREQLQATVSQLPLEVADPVLSYINYFSSPRGRRSLEFGFRRAGRYASMIKRILDEEGLPQEFIFLAQAESAFLPRAVSRMRATGMWQFIKARGNEYGLTQTSLTEDRFDPEKATRAAARHLRDLYAQFGDWYLAVAAYNCGPGNVDRAIQRTGYADFWELYKRNVLPRETANYLPIILAMTIMAKNPKDYGLEHIQPDPPLEYDTIYLSAPTHLALLADLADKPLQLIREMNPAVLKLLAPSGYPVHVPKGAGGSVMASLEAIPGERRASWRIHRVNPSETMAAIARQYRTTEKSIAEANGARSAAIEAEEGDVLLIPVAYPGPAPEAKPKASKSKKVSTRGRSTSSRTVKPAAKPKRTAAVPARRASTRSYAAAALKTR
jgi:membrane-bound lytic murein transglycosylase D